MENERACVLDVGDWPSSTIPVLGIGGATLHLGKAGFEISPMALAAVAGILLNAVLPRQGDQRAVF